MRYSNTRSIITISFLGVSLALMIVIKVVLGFIPGIELTTFFFAVFCLFLRKKEIFLLLVSYLISITIIYGFGSWIAAYWIVYPIDAVVIILTKKLIKNKIIFSGILFCLGFLFLPAYFISDTILFSKNIAIANSISSLPICLIGGFANLISGLILTPILAPILNENSNKIYENFQNIQIVNGGFYSKIFSVFMVLISFVGITLFYYNFIYFQELSDMYNRSHRYVYTNGVLTSKEYNRIHDSLTKNQIAIIGEYNNYTYEEVIDINNKNKTLGNIILDDHSRSHPFTDSYNPGHNKHIHPHHFYFGIKGKYSGLGRLIGIMYVEIENQFQKVTNSHIGASIYITNFSNQGVDFIKIEAREVYQIYYKFN